jgi:guanyl-specific ribonuclease Sa
MRSARKFALQWVAVLAVVATLSLVTSTRADGFADWATIQQVISLVPEDAGTVYDSDGNTDDIQIVNFGVVVYMGPVDVTTTLDRIRSNFPLPHNNDGSIYHNLLDDPPLLPYAPDGYYHEFVHWPFYLDEQPYGMRFPGPMRVIMGGSGEVYFSGDHYVSVYTVYLPQ